MFFTGGFAMIIKATIQINAPLQRVWDVFSDISNWGDWNPVCRECRFETGNSLVKGSCISFELTPVIFPMRIAPEVGHCEPGRKIVWSGSKMGIHAEHEFFFEENDSSPDQIQCNNSSLSSCSLPTLAHNTHYYWKVEADDGTG